MNIPVILEYIRPSEEWTLDGDDYEGLTWLSETPKPTLKEIEAAYPLAQADAASKVAAAVAAKESAMLKLAALGLNVSEVEAIVGSV